MAIRTVAVALISLAAVTTGCVEDQGAGALPPPTNLASAKVPGPDCGGVRPLRPTGGRYTCTFTDDFSGSAVDTSKWVAQQTSLTGMTTATQDCYVNSPSNISVSDGAVHLSARHEDQPFVCQSPFGSFESHSTVATLASISHFDQTNGRFEFRARFPRTTSAGVHSALWLYPTRLSYGAWPKSGEIDVAEWFSNVYDHVYPSVHYEGEPTPWSTGSNCLVSDPWSYHQYAVEWTPASMRFLYDGQECFRHAWTPAAPLVAPQPFDKPFYLVLTQVFGEGKNLANSATPTVATTDVDWVRAWS
jgi:beta-glucanase (GH16 family)